MQRGIPAVEGPSLQEVHDDHQSCYVSSYEENVQHTEWVVMQYGVEFDQKPIADGLVAATEMDGKRLPFVEIW